SNNNNNNEDNSFIVVTQNNEERKKQNYFQFNMLNNIFKNKLSINNSFYCLNTDYINSDINSYEIKKKKNISMCNNITDGYAIKKYESLSEENYKMEKKKKNFSYQNLEKIKHNNN
ncbi:erythrocyte membrane-associated antigen, partial [Plasmodium gaboni]